MKPSNNATPPDLSALAIDPLPFVSGEEEVRERIMRRLIRFNASEVVLAARTLVKGIALNNALPVAEQTLESYMKSQDETVGNIRSRAAGILASATIATTLATSFGLLRGQVNAEALPLPGLAGWLLLGLSVILVSTVILIQRPLTWAFNASTDLLAEPTIRGNVLAARVFVMEVGAQRNEKQIRLLSHLLMTSYAILAFEVVVVLLAVLRIIQ